MAKKKLPKMNNVSRRNLLISLVVAVSVSIIGYVLITGYAAGPFADIEAETGVVTPAAIIDDVAASGGKALQYGGDVPPPTDGDGPGRTVRLMPLGDSITNGTGDSSYGSYRTKLWQLLVEQDQLDIDFVGSASGGPSELGDKNHEGRDGRCISAPCYDGRTDLDTVGIIDSKIVPAQPDVILLHIGTNDINAGVASGAEAVDRLDGLLGQIYAKLPDVYILVAQIIPMNENQQAQTDAYNAGIPGVASKYQQEGRGIRVVDLSDAVSKSAGDYNDGLHPNRQGYDKMGEAWHPAVKEVYNSLSF